MFFIIFWLVSAVPFLGLFSSFGLGHLFGGSDHLAREYGYFCNCIVLIWVFFGRYSKSMKSFNNLKRGL